MIISSDLTPKFYFTGKEKDVELHILDNIHDISHRCNWGDIDRIEQQYNVRFEGGRTVIDIMIWHKNGTGTAIEVKSGQNNRYSLISAIGQVLSYGAKLKLKLSEKPRMVIATPKLEYDIYQIIKEFNLPIELLMIDGDRCIYLPH